MKILVINNLYTPHILGGAEISVQFLSEALLKKGHEVVVACIIPDHTFHIDSINGVKVYYLGLKKNKKYASTTDTPIGKYPIWWRFLDIYNPIVSTQLSKILDIEKPDIVNTNNLAGFSISAWQCIRQKRIKCVHTLRDHYLLCPKSTMFKNGCNCEKQCLMCKIFTLPRLSLSNSIDAVVGNSRFILNRHLDHGYFSSVTKRKVIYNIYEPDLKTESLDHSGNESVRFGYIGRLQKKKGFHFLVKALSGLKRKNWELLIAGNNKELQCRKMDSTHFKLMGFVNPASFYPKIDVLIVPHFAHEPLPRVIFEAFSYGVPVIGSDRGGIPEIITPTKNGFIFPAENMKELQKYLTDFIDHPQKILSMRDHSLNSALDFSKDKISQQYIDFYATLIYPDIKTK